MEIALVPAGPQHKSVIQNMARFYAYDMSKYCGHNPNWEFPDDGLYEAHDFSEFFEPLHFPFLIQIDNELAGFALISKKGSSKDVDWDLGEFFIVGKFQRKGIGRQVAKQIFDRFPGTWEVRQMPDNTPAIKFWKTVIHDYTNGSFSETRMMFSDNEHQYENIVLKFKA